jgi:GT2 family glycosyltransferase
MSIKIPKAAIVILNWNRCADTVECIESVLKTVYSNFEIVVVDNGSSDHSVKMIREKFAQVFLIENNENLGYAEGNNVGIRHALNHGADYVWLLNNDAVVDRNALVTMIDLAERNREIGVLGSKIYYFDKPEIIWFAGATIDWKRAISAHIGRLEKDTGQYEVQKEVDRVTGCSMLIRRDVLESVGLFDEKFFLYAEEVDYCVRARNKGYRIFYVPKSIVYHKVSTSTEGSGGPIFTYYNTRNFLYLIWKNMASPAREALLLIDIIRKLYYGKGTIIRFFIPKIFRKGKITLDDVAPLIGVLHFFTGKMGKGDFEYFMTKKVSW